MSDNVQKYENWRAITESDYVTMFIKTWFAFVATLREMYPKENLEDVIGKGDKAFLNPYLDDFQNRYYPYNNLYIIKDNILKVYKLGRQFTLENSKYNRFFSEDFYIINKSYSWKQTTDDYELSIKYSGDKEISIHTKYLDKEFYINGVPLIITVKINIADLISSETLSDVQVTKFIDDETAFIDFVTRGIINRASLNFIGQITNGNYNSIFSSSVLARLNAITLTINANLIQELALMKEPNIKKEDVLFSQFPCVHFMYDVDDGKAIPEIDTYKWFLNFVYFMRNALFHEIIDPLDAFWQDMFKHSYLALKEVLDGNINYFLEQAVVEKLVYMHAQEEIFSKQDVYIPNYCEHFDNGDLQIKFSNYDVDDNYITAKATITLEYWFDEYTIKRMVSKCCFIVNRAEEKLDKFKIEFVKLEDIK